MNDYGPDLHNNPTNPLYNPNIPSTLAILPNASIAPLYTNPWPFYNDMYMLLYQMVN